MQSRKMKTILLMQPNYTILGKRTWKMAPYNLAILKACLQDRDVVLYDPNFRDEPEEAIRERLREVRPDLVGLTSFSTEYLEEVSYHARLIRQELPEAVIVLGGVLPTVWGAKVIRDENIDYFVLGEGERRFPELIAWIESGAEHGRDLDGIAYRQDGRPVINHPGYFINDLDAIPLPDWGNLDYAPYAHYLMKYAAGIIPRQFPFATTITSRGCPYRCIFCAARTVSGRKVRMRSAQNVLKEIDWYHDTHGIREMIFLDDHFLYDKKRAVEIMQGLIERQYGLTWKCANVAVFSLDEEILDLMRRSGSYQMTLSIESGDQDVVSKIIKKPVNLQKAREMIALAKTYGMEILANFVIGSPGETWEQIRRTIRYAEEIDVDIINIHIATPLPKTELMDICIRQGFLESEDALSGYTEGVISTDEFTPAELQCLRAFEWDRINFATPAKVAQAARMTGISVEEAQAWRKTTRRNLGSTVNWKRRIND